MFTVQLGWFLVELYPRSDWAGLMCIDGLLTGLKPSQFGCLGGSGVARVGWIFISFISINFDSGRGQVQVNPFT